MRFLIILVSLCGVGSLAFGQVNSPYSEPLAPYSEQHLVDVNDFMQSLQWEIYVEEFKIDTVNQWQNWKIVENFSFGKDRGSIPMITDLGALHPIFRDKIIALIAACKKKGIELAVVETYRTRAKQNEYKSMGKKYTRSAGGLSKHQYGLAIDVVPIIDSVADWHNTALWKKIGVAGEKLGLRWGGRWKHPYDPGHFEWTAGLNTYHLASGKTPSTVKKDNYPCIEEDIQQLNHFWNAWETEQSAIARKTSRRHVAGKK